MEYWVSTNIRHFVQVWTFDPDEAETDEVTGIVVGPQGERFSAFFKRDDIAPVKYCISISGEVISDWIVLEDGGTRDHRSRKVSSEDRDYIRECVDMGILIRLS